ncbi:MAG: ABC transporter permease [Anaerovoracaceae bacterium]|nr:ABC transporter permease [Anaerovoracaceae bacterium]
MYRLDPDTGKQKFFAKDGTKSVISAIISILIGMFVGTLIIIFVGLSRDNISTEGIVEGIKLVFFGIFSTGREAGELTFGFDQVNIGNMLFRATPLIMTGLSVAVAFKTGLFNIGAPGQYLMGTTASLYIALTIPTDVMPAWLIWIIAFLLGMLAGALWGAIPGILNAYLNINVVITCIMTNWIAANLVTWFFDSMEYLKNSEEGGKVGYIKPTAANGVETADFGLDKLFAGSQVNGGILIAVLMAVIVYIIMSKTTLGYQLKACGSNRHAARYAGINDKMSIISSMAIAGALAAAGGSLYYLSGNTEFFWSTYQSLPDEGFNGIPVALLASNNPVGVIFTGIFMSMLNVAGTELRTLTAYNEYITDIIIASIVYLSAFAMIIKMFIDNRGKKKKEKAAEEAGAQAAREVQEGGND